MAHVCFQILVLDLIHSDTLSLYAWRIILAIRNSVQVASYIYSYVHKVL